MEHVVAADLVRAVGEAVRMRVARRGQEELGGVGRAARDDDDVGREALGLAAALDDDLGDLGPGSVRPELHDSRIREQRDVRMLERGPHAEHVRVGLRVHEAGEPVAGRAADAVAECGVLASFSRMPHGAWNGW